MQYMYSHRGSAFIIAMGLLTIIVILTLFLMERIQPFSENIKNIEMSNVAYYEAVSGVERALWDMSEDDPTHD